MFRGTMFFTVFLLLGISLGFAQPKIEIVGGDTYDWKKVTPKEEPLKATLQIKNAGNRKLIISDVKPGCGCTTANLEKRELEPNEIVSLPVTLRVSGVHSVITKNIRITSNDPVNKEKMIYLKADIFYPVDVIPGKYMSFTDLKVGKEGSTSILIRNNTTEPLSLSNFEINPPGAIIINASEKEVIKPGKEFQLNVKATPSKTGNFTCLLKIKTDNKEVPELVINGYGVVK